MKTIHFEPLIKHINNLNIFFDDIATEWAKQLEQPLDIMAVLNEKKDKMIDGDIVGCVLLDATMPIGIAWREPVGLHYGNIVLHVLRQHAEADLVQAVIALKLWDDFLLERIQIHQTTVYDDELQRHGLERSDRYRMAIHLADWDEQIVPMVNDIRIEPLTPADISESAILSFNAHAISRDQHLSKDFTNFKKRLALEQCVMSEKLGKIIPGACLKAVTQDGKMCGFCVNIELSCWGYDRVPWVFDLSVAPEYMRQGIGKALMIQAINHMKRQHYPIIGLSATKNNLSAVKLYEALGFFVVEEFVEFGYPLD